MKEVQKNILKFQEQDFFFPIRDKLDYANLILNAISFILIGIFPEKENEVDERMSLKLVVDKMSRLFFFKKHKSFSVAFPFSINIEDERDLIIRTFRGVSVDNKTISSARSILNNSEFILNPSVSDYIIETDESNFEGASLLEEIFQSEPSYIRYDFDSNRENGKIHPLNHLDINYSSYGTFKIGLNNELEIENFKDLLNTKTNCLFVE